MHIAQVLRSVTLVSQCPWLAHAKLQRDDRSAITTRGPLSGRDAIPATMFTCGYFDGDPAKGWAAPSGYDCRVDTAHGIWGFCPTTVIAATDCGLGGYCFDTNTCTSGCGSLSDNPVITTWTCTPSDPQSRYCSMAFLTFGVDQTYEYFHCGPEAATAHLLAFPTAALTITKSTTPLSSSTSSPPTTSLPRATPTSTSSLASPPSTISETTSVPSAPSAASNISTNNSSNTKNDTGAIIGGVIGGLALICGFGGVVVYMITRARSQTARSQQQRAEGTPPLQKISEGGWGPRELPAHDQVRSPVELPGDSFR